MARSVLIVGTMDTKGDQVVYLKDQIEKKGIKTCTINVGVLRDPPFVPDISREEIAQAAGTNVDELMLVGNVEALNRMAKGAKKIVDQMCSRDEVNGVIGLGGSQGTAVCVQVFKAVPFGITKILLSTIAHTRVITPDSVSGDGAMILPWTGGLWGLNAISEQVMGGVAAAIAGAADAYDHRPVSQKPIAGITSLGSNSSSYVGPLKPALEERGYEVAVFHQMGMGRMYERVISDGLVAVSLDLAVGVELLNEVAGGVGTAGKDRLEAAGNMGIPQIVSPGLLDCFHWGSDVEMPPEIKKRFIKWHNNLLGVVESNPEECASMGRMMAEKLNKAKGPTVMVLPMQEPKVPELPPDKDGNIPPLPPEIAATLARRAEVFVGLLAGFREGLLHDLKPNVRYIELDCAQGEPLYNETVLSVFDEMMAK